MIKRQTKNLNILTMRFPLPAVVSILHRMSGVIIYLLMPLVTYAFCYSLESQAHFNFLMTIASSLPIKILLVILVWGICHHLIAGIRHILLDMQVGNDLIVARFTSKTVLLISFFITSLVFYL